MKTVAFVLAAIVWGTAFAQQAPGAVSGAQDDAVKVVPRLQVSKGANRPHVLMAPPVAMAPPKSPELSNEQLAELLRAQTTAIKALATQLDSLDARLGKIETGRH